MSVTQSFTFFEYVFNRLLLYLIIFSTITESTKFILFVYNQLIIVQTLKSDYVIKLLLQLRNAASNTNKNNDLIYCRHYPFITFMS